MSKVKICGLKSIKDIKIVNKIKPNYIGFVLTPSKRQVTMTRAKALKALLEPQIQAVGVFVNEPIESILAYEREGVVDYIQLHGDEDINYIHSLKQNTELPIIKAFRLRSEAKRLKESLSTADYELLMSKVINYVLLDTYHHAQYGGSGQRFNWQLLQEMTRPFFLAGGIGEENIEEALSYKPYAVDISSKVETEGNKDEEKIMSLMKQIQSYANNL